MDNKKKIESLRKEYELSIQKVKEMYMSDTCDGFVSAFCSRCPTTYNLPAGSTKKTWKCGVCGTVNDFDFKFIFVPLKNPNLGPTRDIIEKGLRSKPVKVGINEKRNGAWKEYPCYNRM